jgi:hypothetical protein
MSQIYIVKVRVNYILVAFIALFLICSCNVEEQKKDTIIDMVSEPLLLTGTADFVYTDYAPLKDKPIKVYYHIPSTANTLTPILFVFHGSDRNGKYSRDVLIGNANKQNFILVAPEFSDEFYPTADAYNTGNIFIDGDNPSASTLNSEEIWTFSAIEPLFEFIKAKIGSKASTFDIFGHSAGGQFAHRYLLFKPKAKLNKLAAAASGWYTLFDNKIDFPYGTAKSPVEFSDYGNLFNKKVFILVGDADTDPNSADLRHNSIVDQQGLNRFTRAQYFYTKSRETATNLSRTFNWKFTALKGVGHDFAATSAAATLLLYP